LKILCGICSGWETLTGWIKICFGTVIHFDNAVGVVIAITGCSRKAGCFRHIIPGLWRVSPDLAKGSSEYRRISSILGMTPVRKYPASIDCQRRKTK
jgi:hypothetical protein